MPTRHAPRPGRRTASKKEGLRCAAAGPLPSSPTAALTCTQRRYLEGQVPPEPFLETYLRNAQIRGVFLFTSGFHAVNDYFIQKCVRDAPRGRSGCSTRSLGWWVK
eukprot:3399901-Prymnesium_polylepis.1